MGDLAKWGAIGGAAKGWGKHIEAEAQKEESAAEFDRQQRLENLKSQNKLNVQHDQQRWGTAERKAEEEAAAIVAGAKEEHEIAKIRATGEEQRKLARERAGLGIGTSARGQRYKTASVEVPVDPNDPWAGVRKEPLTFDSQEGRYYKEVAGKRVPFSFTDAWGADVDALMNNPQNAVMYMQAKARAGQRAELPPIFTQFHPELAQEAMDAYSRL